VAFGGRRPLVATGTGSGKAVPGRRVFVPSSGSIVSGVAGEPGVRAVSGTATSSGGLVLGLRAAAGGDGKPRLAAGAHGSGVAPASMPTGSRRDSGPPVAAAGGGEPVGFGAFVEAMGDGGPSVGGVGLPGSAVFTGAGGGLGGVSAVRSVAAGRGFRSGWAPPPELRP
jgi:hypothetical protein